MHAWAVVAVSAVLGAVEAPVTEATVFGDRARVVRAATVEVRGATAVELPLLEESVDPASVRVEAEGATVDRVELQRASPEEFPESEARKLLAELERLDDQISRTQGEREAVTLQLDRLRALVPQRPESPGLQPRPDLDPSGWTASLQFVADRSVVLEQRAREHDQRLLELNEERARKVQQGQLLGGARMTSGWRVTAHLSGSGRAQLKVIYVVPRARWSPLYEIQLNPDANEVQLAFYGLVSQETGDDWKNASLTLSTAVPSNATSFPKLLTWKIGVKDRFIPTPAPMMEQVRPPPPAPPLPQNRSAVLDERSQVMAELNERLGLAVAQPSGRVTVESEQAFIARENARAQALRNAEQRRQEELAARQRRQAAGNVARPMPQAPAPSRSAAPSAAPSAQMENDYVLDGVSVNDPGFGINAAPQSVDVGSTTTGVNVSSDFIRNVAVPAQMSVGLAPPPAYRAPVLDPNSPAARAGGNDLSFTSARREQVLSGKGGSKVALFTEKWPVKLERKLFPALAPYAFLVGELTNPAKQVMPAAPAQLFVGQDSSGTANLKLMNPGEKITLPLGVDRAIKPARNVELVQAEKGFIGKDDVGQYLVTIEIANPYRFPIPVRIHDQWPLKGNEHVEAKLEKVEPAATAKDDAKGTLEWALTIPAGGKTKVSFTYSVKRPKSWRMEQRQEVVR